MSTVIVLDVLKNLFTVSCFWTGCVFVIPETQDFLIQAYMSGRLRGRVDCF